jgi:hypothetical protein
MPVTGKVQFVGTVISSGDFSGYEKARAIDNDFSTEWASDTADNGWIGLDLGASETVSRFEIAASSGSGSADRLAGATFQSASDAVFTTPTTRATLATLPYQSPRVMNSHSITPAAARYWRIAGAAGNYGGSPAEFRIIGTAGGSATSRPCRPTMSPWGGSYISGSVLVTLACETTSAAIYYTTDGSAPDNTKTLYTAPFTLTVGAATQVRAIAYDAGCSTPYSEESNRGRFRNYGFKPNEDWYDVGTGDLLDVHSPSIAEYPVGSGTYWMASTAANNIRSPDQNGYYGIVFHSCDDILNFNWRFRGHVLATPAGSTNVVRPSLLYCASTGKLTLWATAYGGAHQVGNVWSLAVSGSPATAGDWTDHGSLLPDGATDFKDFSRVEFAPGDAYVDYATGAGPIVRSKLNADYLSTTGLPGDRINIPGLTGESPTSCRWNNNGTPTIITINDAVTNYYDSTSSYGVTVVTTTDPLDPDAYSTTTAAYAVDPVGTSFNAQPASIFVVPGKVNGFLLLSDRWVYNPQYDSRLNALPINVAGAAPVVDVPAAWDFDDFEDADPAPTIGAVTVDADGLGGTISFSEPVTPTNVGDLWQVRVTAGGIVRTMQVTLGIVATPDTAYNFDIDSGGRVYAGETVVLDAGAAAFRNEAMVESEAVTGVAVTNGSALPNVVTGPNYAGTGAVDSSAGTVTWTSAGTITASDDSRARASAIAAAGGTSQRLRATNFGFAIAADQEIVGITLEVEQSASVASAIKDLEVYLFDGSTLRTDLQNYANSAFWGTSDAFASYGGPASVWGLAPDVLTPAMVNSAAFGFSIRVQNAHASSASNALVDSVRVTVYHRTIGTAPISQTESFASGAGIMTATNGSWDFTSGNAKCTDPASGVEPEGTIVAGLTDVSATFDGRGASYAEAVISPTGIGAGLWMLAGGGPKDPGFAVTLQVGEGFRMKDWNPITQAFDTVGSFITDTGSVAGDTIRVYIAAGNVSVYRNGVYRGGAYAASLLRFGKHGGRVPHDSGGSTIDNFAAGAGAARSTNPLATGPGIRI